MPRSRRNRSQAVPQLLLAGLFDGKWPFAVLQQAAESRAVLTGERTISDPGIALFGISPGSPAVDLLSPRHKQRNPRGQLRCIVHEEVENFLLSFLIAQFAGEGSQDSRFLLLFGVNFGHDLRNYSVCLRQLNRIHRLELGCQLVQRHGQVTAQTLYSFLKAAQMGCEISMSFFQQAFGIVTSGGHGSLLVLQNI